MHQVFGLTHIYFLPEVVKSQFAGSVEITYLVDDSGVLLYDQGKISFVYGWICHAEFVLSR